MSESGKKATGDDEVEQLLRAAQDDVLLKLNLNSHMARGSSSAAIDPDLDRRFQALRKPQKTPTKKGHPVARFGGAAAEGDDLFARFAALKNSIPSHNRNGDKDGFGSDVAEEEDSEDEVEKVMKWAIDAARLDPSPPSDDDDNCDDDDDDDDDDSDGGKKDKRK